MTDQPEVVELEIEPTPAFDVSCPCCGNTAFQELADRHTWQPLKLEVVDGELREGEYGEFDYGDDVTVTAWQCSDCEDTWGSLRELQAAMMARQAHENLVELLESSSAVAGLPSELVKLIQEADVLCRLSAGVEPEDTSIADQLRHDYDAGTRPD